ncbi:hypothetical protein PR202_ga29534 [Eleusine coracana subsp. coracana]|uniref:Uncharacterized protein n=1 Tax=Eleusine coracana subsp. coracana TaxID=191504 RepID=A0AAV5DMA5_ELECO|nr:hypothetical protein PR202_ga29534 [Eleusine coracana subsp. coracana]
MAGAAGGFVTRALEAMLKECAANRGKFAALQQSIQSYLGAWRCRWHQGGAEGIGGCACCCGHHRGAGVGGARARRATSRAGAAATPPRLRDQARQARGARARLSPRNRSPLFLMILACSAACSMLWRS